MGESSSSHELTDDARSLLGWLESSGNFKGVLQIHNDFEAKNAASGAAESDGARGNGVAPTEDLVAMSMMPLPNVLDGAGGNGVKPSPSKAESANPTPPKQQPPKPSPVPIKPQPAPPPPAPSPARNPTAPHPVQPAPPRPVVQPTVVHPHGGEAPNYPLGPKPTHTPHHTPSGPPQATPQPPLQPSEPTPMLPPVPGPRIPIRHPLPNIGPGLIDGPLPVVRPEEPTVCKDPNGRSVSFTKTQDGKVQFSRPRSKLNELTFSGGGGKGNAYAGIVAGLEQHGAMASVKTIHGASAGSMTAALLASGMTAKEFKEFSDQNNFLEIIGKGEKTDTRSIAVDVSKTVGMFSPLPGLVLNKAAEGVEPIPLLSDGKEFTKTMADAMRASLLQRIDRMLTQHPEMGSDQAISAIITKLKDNKGPTFADMRALSKVVPGVKELVVDTTKLPDGASGSQESVILDADTQPDMDVADAVHASAALPGVFTPVELKTQDGRTTQYQDGGVLNNAPSSETTGFRRNVDPIPTDDSATMLFEGDETDQVESGNVKAPQDGTGMQLDDKKRMGLLGSKGKIENDIGNYRLIETLSKQPKAVLKVPLKFSKDGKSYDETDGTTNFKWDDKKKEASFGASESSVDDFLAQRGQPQTMTFDSENQMLNSISREDLGAMVNSGKPPEAAATMKFRDSADKLIKQLETLAESGGAPDPAAAVKTIGDLDGLARGDAERAAYVGRELNRSGKLDSLFAYANAAPQWMPSRGVLGAGIDVHARIRVEKYAYNIIRDIVQPLLITTTKSQDFEQTVLKHLQAQLEVAKSLQDLKTNITIACEYYKNNPAFPGGNIDRHDLMMKLERSLENIPGTASKDM